MAKIDIYDQSNYVLHIPPAAYSATQGASADGVDLLEYEGCNFIINTGVITSGTWTVTFEHSDSEDSNFTLCTYTSSGTTGQLLGSAPGPFTSTGFNDKIYKVGYIGTKRYVRCVVTETDMGTAIFQVIVELGAPRSAPTPTDLNA